MWITICLGFLLWYYVRVINKKYMKTLNDYKKEYDKLPIKKNLKGKEALEAVKQDGYALQYVKEQIPEICLEAVKQNGYALRYVKEQTLEICLAAVKQDGCALCYVKEQIPEICLEAVKQNGYALRYVKEQTPEICLEAVKQDGFTLRYVNEDLFEDNSIEKGEKKKIEKLDFDVILISDEIKNGGIYSYNAFSPQAKKINEIIDYLNNQNK